MALEAAPKVDCHLADAVGAWVVYICAVFDKSDTDTHGHGHLGTQSYLAPVAEKNQ